MSEPNPLDRHRWIGRPWIARLVRASVYVVPFVAFDTVGFESALTLNG